MNRVPSLAAWVGGVFCLLLTGVVLVWPALVSIDSMMAAEPVPSVLLDGSALARTLLWSLVIAALSVVPGLLAANALVRIIRAARWGRLAAILCIAPLCVPGYAVFWYWWQFTGPGSPIGAWALRMDAAVLLREGVLLIALVCWSWPLVTWPVVLSRLHRAGAGRALAALDRAPFGRRLAVCWREDRFAILLGTALVAFLTAGATISFDLAQVATIGFELRALDATGIEPGALLRLSLPSILLALLGGGVVLALLRSTARRWHGGTGVRVAGGGGIGGPWLVLLLLAGLTVLVPLGSAVASVDGLDPSLFWRLHASATVRTLIAALIDGLLGSLLAGALFIQVVHGGRGGRVLGLLLGMGWMVAALLPAIAVCAALTEAFNREHLGPIIYDTGLVVLFGHLTRSGGVVVAIALFAAFLERRSTLDPRHLDPPRLRGISSRLRSTMLLAGAVAAVTSLGELVVAARLAPPGDGRIATTLLNAMHYQRPDTVLIALSGLVLAGWCLAGVLAWGLPRATRMRSACWAFLLLPLLVGCEEGRAPVADPGVPADRIIGAPGRGPGLFEFPRGIALDAERGCFYVVDKTSRVQRFGLDGTYQTGWRLPEWTVGKPVGISVAPDGRVFVPDTHYHRILVFDPDGKELMRFGSFGTGPGEFVYPTDIAFGPDGSLYIAEYGTNDRIQVFAPDGSYLRGFGRYGRDEGDFARPQSIALSTKRNELYVADTCNHRIGVHALDGTWLRSLAGPGLELGRLSYPHGLELLPDGSLLVSETGSDRVQRLDAVTGESLGAWGVAGFTRGRLRTPWGVASDGERLLVLDSGNARVQIGKLPESRPSTPSTVGP